MAAVLNDFQDGVVERRRNVDRGPVRFLGHHSKRHRNVHLLRRGRCGRGRGRRAGRRGR